MTALPDGASTLLAISGVGITPYSARGLHQTLEPIALSQQTRRTVNGKLVNLAPQQFWKYKSRVTGSDQLPPGLDGVFPGQEVTVECAAELATSGAPLRPAAGVRVGDDGYTYYRPILDMIVTAFSLDTDEWGLQVGWTLDLEEV